MKMKNIKKSDQRILDAIHSRIRWDIRISNSDVAVSVKEGCVTLLGYFDKPYRHAAAVGIIATTDGVEGFVDQSKVIEDYYRTDKDLEVLISKQILAMPFIEGEWIDVAVCDGVAKLEGKVFRSRFKAFAARSAWELSGIKDCMNLIEIKDAPNAVESYGTIQDINEFQNLRSQQLC